MSNCDILINELVIWLNSQLKGGVNSTKNAQQNLNKHLNLNFFPPITLSKSIIIF